MLVVVAASHSLRVTGITGIAAGIVVADLAFVRTVVFVNTVGVFLCKDLVAAVVMTVIAVGMVSVVRASGGLIVSQAITLAPQTTWGSATFA